MLRQSVNDWWTGTFLLMLRFVIDGGHTVLKLVDK